MDFFLNYTLLRRESLSCGIFTAKSASSVEMEFFFFFYFLSICLFDKRLRHMTDLFYFTLFASDF